MSPSDRLKLLYEALSAQLDRGSGICQFNSLKLSMVEGRTNLTQEIGDEWKRWKRLFVLPWKIT